jgi:phosphoesterase RecJ-like protein
MSFYPEQTSAFKRLLEELKGKQVAVLGHARPDGDCIGSQVALCRVLNSQQIDAVCVNADPVPRRLQFLVGDTPLYEAKDFSPEGYVAVTVDCADHKRVGSFLGKAFPVPVGNIDHHISNTLYAEINIVENHSAATGEILAGLFLDIDLSVDVLSAQGLYVGIATDTGQFRFPSTSKRVFRLSSQLIDLGADPAAASNELYEKESFAKLELLGRFLESFKLECNGRVCVGTLRQSDFSETGATSEDTEGLVDYARAIDGVDVGVLIEDRPEGIKGSLRSKEPIYRVDKVASRFSGGGHACAAGLNTNIPYDSFYPQVVEALSELLEEIDSHRG